MLKIRLSRTGKKSQPSFRILVQEHARAVKGGKVVEIVGHYQPSNSDKTLVIKKDRVEHWISVGAQPTDSVATLLKTKEGFKDMDRYIGRRDLKSKKKKAVEEAPAPAPAPVAEAAPAAQEAPVAEEPVAEEAPKEEVSAEEAKVEEQSQ